MKQYSNKLTPSVALAGSQLDNGDVIISTPSFVSQTIALQHQPIFLLQQHSDK